MATRDAPELDEVWRVEALGHLSPRGQQSRCHGPMVKGSLSLGLREGLGYHLGKAYGSQANMLTLRVQ